MSEWRDCTLGKVITSNNQSIGKNYEYKTIQYLDTGSITKGKVEGYQEVDISDAPSRAKRLVKHEDIVYSTVRPIQRHFGFMENPMDNLVVSTGFSVIEVNKELANPKFIYYLLSSDETVEILDVIAEASTSTYPSLKPSDIENLDISLPSLEEQKAIAEVLSSLDDKIDLLHRQNKTLEEMAQTLFRQWFVEEADEEWEEKTLFEAIKLIGSGTPKTSIDEYWNGNICWLSGGDIASSHRSFVINSEKSITELGLQKSSAKLLPKYASVISARGTVGKFCILSKPMTFSQSNYGVVPKLDNTFFFTYLLLSHSVEELQSAAYGSVFDTITTKTFKEHTIKVPTDDEIIEFEKRIESYFFKIEHNSNQIKNLENMRDTLLPKLMSGEVRVKYGS